MDETLGDLYPIFFSQSLEKKKAWMIQTAPNFWSLLSYVGATFKEEQKFCMILCLISFVHFSSLDFIVLNFEDGNFNFIAKLG